MRALWLTENWPPDRGGMAESCDRIVSTLRARDVRVDVVHLSRRHPWLRVAERAAGLELAAPAGVDLAHDLNVLWAWLAARPERAEWTHVVAFGGETPVLAAPVLAAWIGVPLVTLLRGNDFDTAVFSPRRRPALAEAVRASACVCAVAGSIAERAQALWPDARIERIANGIDLDTWTATDADRERAAAWRARHVADGVLVLGLIGHLKAKKGVTLLLEALRRSGRGADVHLLIAGPVDAEVDAWLERFGGDIAATIESERERLELISLYLACDLVCLPSFYDGLPNACVEAFALGVPVLAARTGGLADVVADGVTGITFPPGDVEGCRDALERALAKKPGDQVTWLFALGTAARAFAVAELSHEREADAYVACAAGDRGAMTVVAYALGGGLGHLVRTRAVLAALDMEAAAVLVSSPQAADPRAAGGLPVEPAPPELARDRAGLARWVSRRIAAHAPSVVLVDAFPGGVLGELSLVPELRATRLFHVARLLRWDRYAPRLGGAALPAFARVLAVEELHRDHAEALGGGVEPLVLPPPVVADPDARAVGRTLVVHSGPAAEVMSLVARARRARPGDEPLVVSPHHLDAVPAAPLIAAAAFVVCAGGFNAVREATTLAPGRHLAAPLPRPLDDQQTRVARL